MHSFPNLFDQGTIFLESISVVSVLQNMALGNMDVDKKHTAKEIPMKVSWNFLIICPHFNDCIYFDLFCWFSDFRVFRSLFKNVLGGDAIDWCDGAVLPRVPSSLELDCLSLVLVSLLPFRCLLEGYEKSHVIAFLGLNLNFMNSVSETLMWVPDQDVSQCRITVPLFSLLISIQTPNRNGSLIFWDFPFWSII